MTAVLINNRLRDHVDMFWPLSPSIAYYSLFFTYSWSFCLKKKALIYVAIMTAKLQCEGRVGFIWRHITHRNYSSTNRPRLLLFLTYTSSKNETKKKRFKRKGSWENPYPCPPSSLKAINIVEMHVAGRRTHACTHILVTHIQAGPAGPALCTASREFCYTRRHFYRGCTTPATFFLRWCAQTPPQASIVLNNLCWGRTFSGNSKQKASGVGAEKTKQARVYKRASHPDTNQ